MRCCGSDWTGLCLFCYQQIDFGLFSPINYPILLPPGPRALFCINPCVLSANRVDLVFYFFIFLFHKLSNFTLPQALAVAVLHAVNTVVQPVIDRTVGISNATALQLALKDHATQPNHEVLLRNGILMVKVGVVFPLIFPSKTKYTVTGIVLTA